MSLFKRVRKDAPTSEGAHVFRGMLGVIIIIALVIAALTYWFPPATSASPQKTSKSASVSAPVANAKVRGPQ